MLELNHISLVTYTIRVLSSVTMISYANLLRIPSLRMTREKYQMEGESGIMNYWKRNKESIVLNFVLSTMDASETAVELQDSNVADFVSDKGIYQTENNRLPRYRRHILYIQALRAYFFPAKVKCQESFCDTNMDGKIIQFLFALNKWIPSSRPTFLVPVNN